MSFYYTLKPTKDTRRRLKVQGLHLPWVRLRRSYCLTTTTKKKKPEKSVAFLYWIAIYGNPIIITSDGSVVLCVTELFRT